MTMIVLPQPVDSLAITLKDIRYYRRSDRGDVPILNKVNWSISKGYHWILFGPNGSGKTTLLKIIMGFIFPSEGTAVVLHETIGQTDIWELQKHVSWVTAAIEPLMHDEDPVLEIVLAGLQASTRLWFSVTDAEKRIALEILKKLKLESKKDQTWEFLSQGERKKVLIARSLMIQPQILLLDEPCEGLDIGAREGFLKDLGDLIEKDSNLTVIYVTHHVEEIPTAFTKTLILKMGLVFREGNTSKVITTEVLSELFDMPIQVTEKQGRYSSHLY
jgi:iron complex transport system ATP-binding protein